MHTVAVLALDQVIPFDLSTPIEVFGRTRLPGGRPGYRVRVCAPSPSVDAGPFTIQAPWGLDALADADTIIVPGVADVSRRPPPDVLDALTSAGAAAGLDLCLHLIRRDYGSAVAADAARLSVMPLEREGGQAQFIVHEQPPTPKGSALEPVMRWMEENAGRELALHDIAERAGMSTRTVMRRFREQTGTSPLQWLPRARVRQAQHPLETTGHSVERIASQVGFGSATAFRERFKKVTGVSPQSYRRTFQ
ncbi:helix-turn-helix domain-containing protein [Nonomuraea sp. NPDC049152]|uniref:GlxA family transcriptional regulator n=1 Tax=Nonomuraea sp. NPDC049152 TaxID=3154350 RepID=UPI0033C6AB60